MPWVAGEVVSATGKNRVKAAAQRVGGDVRRWNVAERIQGWKVGDKNCVTSVYKALIYEGIIYLVPPNPPKHGLRLELNLN